MPKIKLLDKQVAELIAAGEVVERPASVIKELVENSIDAGADVITVEISRGGTDFMRITDNGCGIERAEIPTAFLRHATSKINSADDLEAIGTLGFRGEALASISTVSRLEMLTKTRDEDIGSRYYTQGGDSYLLEDAGCPNGTTIIIRDLFFNVPARMKFLKKDVTEGNAVAGILDKIALSHPEISMRFIRDGKEQLRTPGDNDLKSAIYAVYGKAFSEGLIAVNYTLNHIGVTGYISLPSAARSNRSMQSFFINHRYIKSKTAGVALDQAFKGSVMTGKFAACVLNLEMNLELVDVNVHPAKLEVRFVNEKPVFDAVYHAVKNALKQRDKPKIMEFRNSKAFTSPYAAAQTEEQLTIIDRQKSSYEKKAVSDEDIVSKGPGALTGAFKAHQSNESKASSVTGKEEMKSGQALPEDIEINTEKTSGLGFGSKISKMSDAVPQPITRLSGRTNLGSFLNIEVMPEEDPMFEGDLPEPGALPKPGTLPESETLPESKPAEEAETDVSAVPFIDEATEGAATSGSSKYSRFVGEAFGTYIILQYGEDGLMLIDKHAAHERLLYEKLKRETDESIAQTLLEPLTVTLEKGEYDTALSNIELLYKAGFEIEDFGPGMILMRTVPMVLEGGDGSAAIMEIVGHLSENNMDISTEHLDWVFHNVACRAAVKGGDRSSDQELIALAKQLEETPELRYCPHGRPVYILLKKGDLERQFGR